MLLAIGEPNNQSQILETILRAAESCLEPGRSTVEPHRASSVVEGSCCGGCKPYSANHRSNEQALKMIFVFRHPLTPTGRRDAGRRRRRLLWSRCDAGAIPCPGKWERDPQALIRLGAHPRPGEGSCCYLIAHGEVAQVRSLRNEARSTRAVSRRAVRTSRSTRDLVGRQACHEEFIVRRLSARGLKARGRKFPANQLR